MVFSPTRDPGDASWMLQRESGLPESRGAAILKPGENPKFIFMFLFPSCLSQACSHLRDNSGGSSIPHGNKPLGPPRWVPCSSHRYSRFAKGKTLVPVPRRGGGGVGSSLLSCWNSGQEELWVERKDIFFFNERAAERASTVEGRGHWIGLGSGVLDWGYWERGGVAPLKI